MKRQGSQKTVPPRTIVPKILAALAAGAFTLGTAIGAYVWLEHGGTAKISGAEVAIKNCTFKLDSTAPEAQWGVIGGLAVSKEDSGGGASRGVAEVAHSKVTIAGGNYSVPDGGDITVAGGAAYT